MLDFFKYHEELLYHPKPKVTKAYIDHFNEKGYDSLKMFFQTLKGRYIMIRPDGWNQLVIDQAFENQDSETVIDAYLDTLDYAKELNDETFVKVLESASFEESVDHVLYGHVKEQMDERGLDSRIQMCVYYLNVNGGLTAADMLLEIAMDNKVTNIHNSEFLKRELFDKVFDEESTVDSFVRDKVKDAIKVLKPKLDQEFYGLEEPAPEEPEQVEAPAAQEEEAQKEESA